MSEFFRKPIVKTLMLKGEKGETGDSDYQPAVDALGKRIDNLILSSGTESSAEVVDARTGYDGTTYDTLGTAIRSQVSELKGDLVNQGTVYNFNKNLIVDKFLKGTTPTKTGSENIKGEYCNILKYVNSGSTSYADFDLSTPITSKKVYISFRAKSENSGCRFNITEVSGSSRNRVGWVDLSTEWKYYNVSFDLTFDSVDNILISLGNVGTTYLTNLIISNEIIDYDYNVKLSIEKIKEEMETYDFTPKDVDLYGKTWYALGDSITASEVAYHKVIADKYGCIVTNGGVSGTGYMKQVGSTPNTFVDRSNLSQVYDIVTVMGSINDMGYTDEPYLGTATDSGTETLGGRINTVIDNIYASGNYHLGIISPIPNNSYNGNPIRTSGTFVRFCNLLEEICKLRGVPYLDLWHSSNLQPWDDTFRANYMIDNTHPNENGHKIIANRIKAFIKSL